MAPKIYIVDQSTLIKNNLKKHLETAFDIKTGDLAGTALLEIIDWQPDIIIAGIELGQISGFDLCIILKMIPEYASKPFIILSSHKKEGVSEKAQEVGADLYLEKKLEVLANIKDQILTLLPDNHPPSSTVSSILLVDDSPIIRIMMSNMLKGIGIEHITEAVHGLEALQKLKEQKFDLLITDYHMPEMNGPDLITEIRTTMSGKELPIILATGSADHDINQKFEDVDLQAIIIKPLSAADLRHAIASIAECSE